MPRDDSYLLHSMASTPTQRRHLKRSQHGYVLLTLLLMMALLAIAAAIIVPTIKSQMERDREEEMIHRGVQYSRAIRAYYKKFGRYPVKLEDLESTNNLKFLRKRYKDPENCAAGKCEDFKLLHFGEVKMFGNAGIAGAVNAADLNNSSPGGLGQSSLGQSSPGQSSGFGASGGLGQSTLGGSSLGGNSGLGNSSSGFGNSSLGQNQQSGSSTDSSQNGTSPSATDSSSGNSGGVTGQNSNGQVFGGGPIVGVVSSAKCPPKPKDKCEGFREFNHKKKYSDWQFVYDPGSDRGGLLMTPNQPPIQGFGQPGTQNVNGQNGTNGTTNGFGTSSGFGSSGSFGNGFGNSPGTQNNPTPPSNPPQQQQQ
jgi:type II secretory pathway pseudopilin PulG